MRTRSLFAILFLLLLLPVLLSVSVLQKDQPTPFFAQRGVLDLRGYDLDQQAAVEFGGGWDFYWQRLLEPKDFQGAAPVPDAFLNFPGSWKDLQIRQKSLDGNGYATLHLVILSKPTQIPQAIRIAQVFSAYRLWANGHLIAESGHVGTTRDSEVMMHSVRIAALPLDGKPVDLVLQVSCFYMDKASLPALQMGRQTELNANQNRVWGVALFSAGTLLLMGIYHIALYALYRSNRSPLYFGIYCLVWMGFVVSNATSDWSLRVFLPELSGEMLYRSSLCYYALAAPLSYHVFRSLYPKEFPRWLLLAFWVTGGAYGLISLFASTNLSAVLLPFFHLLVAGRACFFLWALALATQRRREGAAIIFTGFVIVFVLSLNDILNSLNLIHTPHLMPVGMLSFMLAQSLALAQRFTGLFSKVENLSVALSAQNHALEGEIAERARLQQEIVSISEEERRRISYQLHDGLCQQLTGARLQSSVLEGEWADEASRSLGQARLSQLLAEAVDHAYQLSRGLWSMGPESEDVCQAMRMLAQTQSESNQIPVHFELHTACLGCAANHAVQIYCIAREAIINAVKHANPSRIELSLDCRGNGHILLSIADDGIGRQSAAPSKAGLGLRIMSHRAQMIGGSFRIEDQESGGTRVICSIPCAMRGKAADSPLLEKPADCISAEASKGF